MRFSGECLGRCRGFLESRDSRPFTYSAARERKRARRPNGGTTPCAEALPAWPGSHPQCPTLRCRLIRAQANNTSAMFLMQAASCLPSLPWGRGWPATAFSSAGAGRAFARRRATDAPGAQPATARRRVRGCAGGLAHLHGVNRAFTAIGPTVVNARGRPQGSPVLPCL